MIEHTTDGLMKAIEKRVRPVLLSALQDARGEARREGENKGRHEGRLDINAARTELREIAASFTRNDLADVRARLMDLGTILKLDLWIPSR